MDDVIETRQATVLNVSLEASRIENIASTYPESIRDDVIWLAGYVREQCSRDLEILVHRTRKLGFSTDRGTYQKIFRGRYQTDSDGNPTKHPIISPSKFNQIVEALRSQAKHVWLAGKTPFIETPTWTQIDDYITTKWSPETICKFGLILGHTGTQKTTCAKHFQHLNNSGRCVHIEAPEKPTPGRFIRELAKAFGVPEKLSGEKLRMRINENLNEKKCIIVDNIQRLYKPRHGWQQEIFNYLQKIQDDTGCTIIMMAVPNFEETLRAGSEKGYFEQFVGRVGGWSEILRLEEFPDLDDIKAIADAYGIKDLKAEYAWVPKDSPKGTHPAGTVLKKLQLLSQQPGRIRILFNALQKAKRLVGDPKRPILAKHLCEALDEVEPE